MRRWIGFVVAPAVGGALAVAAVASASSDDPVDPPPSSTDCVLLPGENQILTPDPQVTMLIACEDDSSFTIAVSATSWRQLQEQFASLEDAPGEVVVHDH